MADPQQGLKRDFEQKDADEKFPSVFCEVAFQLRDALDEGRIEDAKRIAIEHLQVGFHSQPFALIIAEMLGAERRAGARGRKPRRYPPNWIEIGHDFRRLMKSGISYEETRAQLSKKYHRSERSIETVRAYFEKSEEVFLKSFQRSYRNSK